MAGRGKAVGKSIFSHFLMAIRGLADTCRDFLSAWNHECV